MQTTAHHPPPPSPNAAPTVPSRAAAPWQETYLDTLADTGQKAKAARQAGISLRLVVRRRHQDPAFARLEQEAMEASFDMMESEAVRRAVEGLEVSRPGRKGEVVTRTIYSDTLLLKILQRHLWNKPPKDDAAASAPAAPNLIYPTAADRRAALDRAKAEMAAAEKRDLQCDPRYRQPPSPTEPPNGPTSNPSQFPKSPPA